ncbi:TetR/AcrR family transcriptional regulator [Amycolatopsis nigrescens]|uniref:TetR/AcrR family transcriptional regulator n=1 Tax=Amycolatopsis nigrescens TaxID=381445 RepID=UPI00035FF72E|nr:TetR/AcrR family transcriptional regulator [Amycolatopsis nigrescens]
MSGTRTRLNTADRKTLLLRATCHVIARRGVRGLRVEDVAAKAEVSTTLLYYHFTNRAGLLAATMEYVNDRAGSYTAAPAGLTGRQQLLHQLLAEFQDTDEVRDNSAVWNEFRATAVFDPSLHDIAKAATGTWNADIADTIARGQADGSIGSGVDPGSTAERLTALVEGLSNRWLTGMLGTDRAHQQVRTALDKECPLGS